MMRPLSWLSRLTSKVSQTPENLQNLNSLGQLPWADSWTSQPAKLSMYQEEKSEPAHQQNTNLRKFRKSKKDLNTLGQPTKLSYLAAPAQLYSNACNILDPMHTVGSQEVRVALLLIYILFRIMRSTM